MPLAGNQIDRLLTLESKCAVNLNKEKNGMRVDAMRLGTETMTFFVSELTQNPIISTILSD